jgi:hypothetical protein
METDWNPHKGYLNGFSVQTQREALLRAIDSLLNENETTHGSLTSTLCDG